MVCVVVLISLSAHQLLRGDLKIFNFKSAWAAAIAFGYPFLLNLTVCSCCNPGLNELLQCG